MFTVSLAQVAIVVLVGLIGYGGVKLYCRWDEKKENRRRKAIKVAAELQSAGLKRLPAILTAYAVGDYSGIAAEIMKFCDAIEDGIPVVMQEFNSVFNSIFEVKLSTPEGRAYITQKLAEMESKPAAQTVATPVAGT